MPSNYFEILPDHLGNNQRLFERYGPIFKTTSLGRTVFQINDAELAAIVFAETDFFTKRIPKPKFTGKEDPKPISLDCELEDDIFWNGRSESRKQTT